MMVEPSHAIDPQPTLAAGFTVDDTALTDAVTSRTETLIAGMAPPWRVVSSNDAMRHPQIWSNHDFFSLHLLTNDRGRWAMVAIADHVWNLNQPSRTETLNHALFMAPTASLTGLAELFMGPAEHFALSHPLADHPVWCTFEGYRLDALALIDEQDYPDADTDRVLMAFGGWTALIAARHDAMQRDVVTDLVATHARDLFAQARVDPHVRVEAKVSVIVTAATACVTSNWDATTHQMREECPQALRAVYESFFGDRLDALLDRLARNAASNKAVEQRLLPRRS